MSAPRSRKTFRFMPAPVLSHNVEREARLLVGAAPASSSFGRGLYGKKLAESEPAEAPRQVAPRPPRAPRTVLRWQVPLNYLVVWQRGGLTLTWHAPWCRRCDCPGAGWRFGREGGYVSGLGFELSYLRESA